MKKLFFYFALLLTSTAALAQENLPAVHLPEGLTLHFISPEPIRYVDISSKALTGDLPLDNVLRIRLKDSVKDFSHAVVTIAGDKFIAQYEVLPGVSGIPGVSGSPLEINIMPADTRPLDISGVGLSQSQLRGLSLNVLAGKPGKRREKVAAFGIKGQLNHVYTLDDYIFLDISYKNKARLKYDIDAFRFSLDDKKVTKASNVQSVDLKPVFVLENTPAFSKYYRNIFVFKKLTFPGNKTLKVELDEKQLSGRIITLEIAYKDILGADSIPN